MVAEELSKPSKPLIPSQVPIAEAAKILSVAAPEPVAFIHVGENLGDRCLKQSHMSCG